MAEEVDTHLRAVGEWEVPQAIHRQQMEFSIREARRLIMAEEVADTLVEAEELAEAEDHHI
jgi:hypothetical protein